MSGQQGKHHSHDNDTPVIPPRNPHEEFSIGTEFTGVIDGLIPGGYLLRITKANGVTLRLRGSMSTSDQQSIIQGDVNINVPLVSANVNLQNSEACINLNTKKEIPELEVGDDFSQEYSYFEMSSPSDQIQMPYLLQYFDKFEPVGFQLVNQANSSSKGLSIDLNSAPTPTGHRISKDPFLPRNFPSPAGSIRPPEELIPKRSLQSKQGEKKGNNSKGKGVLHF